MDQIFLVNHVIENAEGEDSIKLIGVFSTQELAERAVVDHRVLSGFSDYPDGFEISRIEIDKSQWNEGFLEIESENKSGDRQTT